MSRTSSVDRMSENYKKKKTAEHYIQTKFVEDRPVNNKNNNLFNG